ncbi:MAG: molybdopterin cofactor-binding domain-containing protein, partial [Acidimicrobiales bacterium]
MSTSRVSGVGFDGARFDAEAKVTGEARYPADAVPADALHAIAVFSNEPHARMTAMSTEEAEAVDGVVVVLTAEDVPVNEYGLTKTDQPVLVGLNDTGRSEVPSDVSRWEADHVAVIVAETVEAAREAAARLAIEWEQLPLVETVEAARADDVLLHPNEGSNVYNPLRIRKGDIDSGWAQADVVIEDTYELPHQEHAFLQVESATAWI